MNVCNICELIFAAHKSYQHESSHTFIVSVCLGLSYQCVTAKNVDTEICAIE